MICSTPNSVQWFASWERNSQVIQRITVLSQLKDTNNWILLSSLLLSHIFRQCYFFCFFPRISELSEEYIDVSIKRIRVIVSACEICHRWIKLLWKRHKNNNFVFISMFVIHILLTIYKKNEKSPKEHIYSQSIFN